MARLNIEHSVKMFLVDYASLIRVSGICVGCDSEGIKLTSIKEKDMQLHLDSLRDSVDAKKLR